MKINKLYFLILLCGCFSTNFAIAQDLLQQDKDDNEIELSEIEVGDANVRTQSINTAGAISERGENKQLQSVDNVLRSIPGTFSQIDPAQGGVTVNIRGLAGMGRVNTMVDGVSQTFFGTAAGVQHGSTGTSQFATLIDSNFIVGVDVSRGVSSGSTGINSLVGSANFRTIDVEDVVKHGNQYGIRSKFNAGNNGLGFNAMLAGAVKKKIYTDGSIGALVAVSGSKIKGVFQNASGTSSDDFFGEINKEKYQEMMKQKPKSILMKFNFEPNEFHRLSFSERRYINNISRRKINSDNLAVKYSYTPFSELINLNTTLAYINEKQSYTEANSIGTMGRSDVSNKGINFDISNASHFSLYGADSSITVGAKYVKNKYSRNLTSTVSNIDNANSNIEHTPLGIPGDLEIASAYLDASFNKGIYTLDSNFGYGNYKVSGFDPGCSGYVVKLLNCMVSKPQNITNRNSGFNTSLLFSAQYHEQFQPFASYAMGFRAPNPQEIFFNNESGHSINPNLAGETVHTIQIGFNGSKDNIFKSSDNLTYKVLAYQSNFKNYIYAVNYRICKFNNGTGYLCKASEQADALAINDEGEIYDGYNGYLSINHNRTVSMHGLELEASYDSDSIYATASLTLAKTNQPLSASTDSSFSQQDLSELPKWYSNIDIGTKLLNNKLKIGLLTKLTGSATMTEFEGRSDDQIKKQSFVSVPAIFDLYANYELTNSFSMRFNIQNLTNRNYSDALNKMNNLAFNEGNQNTARGRTYIFGLDVRF